MSLGPDEVSEGSADRGSKRHSAASSALLALELSLLFPGIGLMVLSLSLPFVLFEYTRIYRIPPYYAVVVDPILGEFNPILFLSLLGIVLLIYSSARGSVMIKLYAVLISSLCPVVLLVLRALGAWPDATFTTLEGFNLYTASIILVWASATTSLARGWRGVKAGVAKLRERGLLMKQVLLCYLLVAAVSLQVAGLFMYFEGTLIMVSGQWVIYKPTYGFEEFAVFIYYVALGLLTYAVCRGASGAAFEYDGPRTLDAEIAPPHTSTLAYSCFLFAIIPVSVIASVYIMYLGPGFPGWIPVVLSGCYMFLAGSVALLLYATSSVLARRGAAPIEGIGPFRQWVGKSRVRIMVVLFFVSGLATSILLALGLGFSWADSISWAGFAMFLLLLGLDAVLLLSVRGSASITEASFRRNAVDWVVWTLPVPLANLLAVELFWDLPFLFDPYLLDFWLRIPLYLGNGVLSGLLFFMVDSGLILLLRRLRRARGANGPRTERGKHPRRLPGRARLEAHRGCQATASLTTRMKSHV